MFLALVDFLHAERRFVRIDQFRAGQLLLVSVRNLGTLDQFGHRRDIGRRDVLGKGRFHRAAERTGLDGRTERSAPHDGHGQPAQLRPSFAHLHGVIHGLFLTHFLRSPAGREVRQPPGGRSSPHHTTPDPPLATRAPLRARRSTPWPRRYGKRSRRAGSRPTWPTGSRRGSRSVRPGRTETRGW